jgi:hypothetical protein
VIGPTQGGQPSAQQLFSSNGQPFIQSMQPTLMQ